VEEAEAAPVWCKAAAQVIPALDLVDCFIGDQLFQHRGRGLPVYALEFEEAAIEPGPEQMTQVRVEWFQVRLTAQMSEQILAHGYQRCGAARHHVHAAQQLLAGRLGRLGKLGGALGRGLREVGLRGRPELVLCRQKVLNEKAIKRDPICGPELAQCRMQLPRDRRT
jgi:hypothetical protein